MTEPGGKEGGGQPLHPAPYHGNPAAAGRRLVRLDPVAAQLFKIRCEPLEVINSHRLVDQLPPAFRLAGTRAYPADHRRERIALLDDLDRPAVVAESDLPDIFPDVDPGRTGPLAGGGTLLHRVFAHDAPGNGGQGDDMLRADALTDPTAGATLRIHDGKPFRAHVNGVERAGARAGSETDTANGAHLHAAAQHGGGAAISEAMVDEPGVGLTNPEITPRPRDVGFHTLHRDAQKIGDGLDHLRAGRHAGVRCGFAGDDRLGVGGTARHAAAAAVRTGQSRGDRLDLRVNIDIEELGRHRQH